MVFKFYFFGKPILGCTKNVTPQLQGNITFILRKKFISNFISKNYPSHVGFEILIGFTEKLILIFQMNGQGKSFKKITLGVPLFMNAKGTCFFNFLNIFNF